MGSIPAPPKYPLRQPKYHLIETIRRFNWGVPGICHNMRALNLLDTPIYRALYTIYCTLYHMYHNIPNWCLLVHTPNTICRSSARTSKSRFCQPRRHISHGLNFFLRGVIQGFCRVLIKGLLSGIYEVRGLRKDHVVSILKDYYRWYIRSFDHASHVANTYSKTRRRPMYVPLFFWLQLIP